MILLLNYRRFKLWQRLKPTQMFEKAWEGFKGTDWKEKLAFHVSFSENYTPYDGDQLHRTNWTLSKIKIVDETKQAMKLKGRFPMDTRPTGADIDAGLHSKEDEHLVSKNDELFNWTSCLKVVSVWRKLFKKKRHGWTRPSLARNFHKIRDWLTVIFRAYTKRRARPRSHSY